MPRLKKLPGLNLNARHMGYTYQVEAVEAVKSLEYAALFHEQGLGKTKIGIDLALEWLRQDEVDCVLFVTKRSLVKNWTDEIRSHTNMLPAVLDQDHRSNFFRLNSNVRFLLAHFEVLKSEEKRFALFLKTRRVAVILDEAQKIKNPDAALTKSFHRLRAGFHRRVIMTGTPIANRPYDIWAQVYFLDGGKSLGDDFDAFRAKLDLSNDLWQNETKRTEFETELGRIFGLIKPFTVRETKNSAEINLPEKHVYNVPVELETKQRELYLSIKDELSAQIVSDGKIITDDAESVLKRMLRLVQVASNPALIDESYTTDPGKFGSTKEIIAAAVAEKSKVIVWTSFISNAEWLSNALREFDATYVHGGLSIERRNASIDRFKYDDNCKVLVATPGAAKEGLTLTMANHAIFFDRSFSLDDYLQAQDRIHRISQKQECYVWNLVGRDTIDEWVDSLLTAKRLAAQLAQSDITSQEYSQNSSYEFGNIIREILGLELEN